MLKYKADKFCLICGSKLKGGCFFCESLDVVGQLQSCGACGSEFEYRETNGKRSLVQI